MYNKENLDLKCVRLAARIILENGGEIYRAEDTAQRIGVAMGYDQVEVFAVPSGIFISLNKKDSLENTSISRIRKRNIDLNKVNMVNQVSREIVQGELSCKESYERLLDIQQEQNTIHYRLSPYIAAFTSAAFTLMFSGQGIDLLIAAVCAFLTQLLIRVIEHRQMYQIFTSLIGGIICTFIPLLFKKLTGFGNVEQIVAGALMPLVPGLAMTNALSDTIRGDLLSGVTHTFNAFLIAALIAGGSIFGQSLFNLLGG